MTLPRAVILNRLATDFFVLIPLGRLINCSLSFQKNAKYRSFCPAKQGVILGHFGNLEIRPKRLENR
jgi:hypothetical protein